MNIASLTGVSNKNYQKVEVAQKRQNIKLTDSPDTFETNPEETQAAPAFKGTRARVQRLSTMRTLGIIVSCCAAIRNLFPGKKI